MAVMPSALGLSSSQNSLNALAHSASESNSDHNSNSPSVHHKLPRSSVSKEAILTQSSKGWSSAGSVDRSPSSTGIQPKKNPLSMSTSSSMDSLERENQHVQQPRRTSNSFKQLQRNLVSSSPFKSPDFSSNSSLSPSRQPRTTPLPRASRVGGPIGLGIREPASPTEPPVSPLFSSEDDESPVLKSAPFFKRAPRQTTTFTSLQTRNLVSNSPFVQSPSVHSSDSEASPPTHNQHLPEPRPAGVLGQSKRMTGPRALSPTHVAGSSEAVVALTAEVTYEGDPRNLDSHRDVQGLPRNRSYSKSVTWGDNDVHEFTKEEYEDDSERRSSLASGSSSQSEGEEGSQSPYQHKLDSIPTAEEMVHRLMQEEAAERARFEAQKLEDHLDPAARASQEEDPQIHHLESNRNLYVSEQDLSHGKASPSLSRRPLPVPQLTICSPKRSDSPPLPPGTHTPTKSTSNFQPEQITVESLQAELQNLGTPPLGSTPPSANKRGPQPTSLEDLDTSSEYDDKESQQYSPIQPLRSLRSVQDMPTTSNAFSLPTLSSSSPLPNFGDFNRSPIVDDEALQDNTPLMTAVSLTSHTPKTPGLVLSNTNHAQAHEERPSDSKSDLPHVGHKTSAKRGPPPRLTREAIQERMRQKHLGAIEDTEADVGQAAVGHIDSAAKSTANINREGSGAVPTAERSSLPSLNQHCQVSDDLKIPGDEVSGNSGPLSTLASDVASSLPSSPSLPTKNEQEDDTIASERRAKDMKNERPKRRRSKSTGDASLSSPQSSFVDSSAEHSLSHNESHLDPSQSTQQLSTVGDLPTFGHSASFAESLDKQLQATYEQSDKTYRTVEHKVVAGDNVRTIGNAGDVQGHRAWRRISRPSDMNAYASELRELRSGISVRKPSGIVFLSLRRVRWSVSMPRYPVRLSRLLSNSDSTVRSETSELMKPEMDLPDQWELLRRQSLTFKVAFQADLEAYKRAAASDAASLQTANRGSPSGGFRSRLFGSPKKQKSTPVLAPTPDHFAQYLGRDGILAVAQVDFEQYRPQCVGKRHKLTFSLVNPATGRHIGSIDTNLFYLPPLAPLSTQLWPKSMDECQEGMRLLQKLGAEQRVILKGELSQVGADCQFWRRRCMVVKGTQLIAFNEVTKRPHTCFELTHATAVEDCAATMSHTPPTFSGRSRHAYTHSDPEEEPYADVPHSFRLILQAPSQQEPEIVYFYADNDAGKEQWMQVLGHVIHNAKGAGQTQPPLWAVYMEELLASQGKVREVSSESPAANTTSS